HRFAAHSGCNIGPCADSKSNELGLDGKRRGAVPKRGLEHLPSDILLMQYLCWTYTKLLYTTTCAIDTREIVGYSQGACKYQIIKVEQPERPLEEFNKERSETR
ncbi:MAG TPA: hypothetical protein VFE62_23815, partial [Gemmataceae bacterium]|nr:hypothetical protein [Gemmataceae bacterium]